MDVTGSVYLTTPLLLSIPVVHRKGLQLHLLLIYCLCTTECMR